MGMPLFDWILSMTMQLFGSPQLAAIILLICLAGFVALYGVTSHVSLLFFGAILIWIAAPVSIGGIGALPVDVFFIVLAFMALFASFGLLRFLQRRQ